ncbi:hypothetical protein B0T19DRAFT_395426 [Cercophora scortea]|uniref:Uncharacterized protein n=1 Tax=Cercophora scortea TaxID=314031 RepID=A0AAE0J270_9PEZI|nr:hypothetical protein B0T19DRAFT_395426 [Cercophora scortea]
MAEPVPNQAEQAQQTGQTGQTNDHIDALDAFDQGLDMTGRWDELVRILRPNLYASSNGNMAALGNDLGNDTPPGIANGQGGFPQAPANLGQEPNQEAGQNAQQATVDDSTLTIDSDEKLVEVTRRLTLEALRRRLAPQGENERPQVVQAGLGEMCKTLIVDTGDRNTLLTGPSVTHLLHVEELKLLAGWWMWRDFSIDPQNSDRLLPALFTESHAARNLRRCHMAFWGSPHSLSGFFAHRYIFALSTLKHLKFENHPDMVDDWTLIDFEGVAPLRSTALDVLDVSGLDIQTLENVFKLPAHLRHLKLEFKAPATRSFVSDFMQTSTDELLTRALSPLFATLYTLDFHHDLLTNFKWSKFRRLVRLRTHPDHFFPCTRRTWGDLTLDDLLPPMLGFLTLDGCKFGIKDYFPPFDDKLELSILRLLDELNQAHGMHPLRHVRLSLAEDSPQPVPEVIKQRFSESRVRLEITTDKDEVGESVFSWADEA